MVFGFLGVSPRGVVEEGGQLVFPFVVFGGTALLCTG
jgi:hypothetical protein